MSDPAAVPYRYETERLVLRCWQPEDAPLLKAAVDASLDHLSPWMPWAKFEPSTLAQKRQLIRTFRGKYDLDADYVLGLFDAAESEVLGGSGLHTRQGPEALEIGYWIHAAHCRRGYASEVARALTAAAFRYFDVARVEIRCDPANQASAAVPAKLGFTNEGTRRGLSEGVDGSPRDTVIWTMLRDEYPESPCAAAVVRAFDATGARIEPRPVREAR